MTEGRIPKHGEQVSPTVEYCANCDDFVKVGHTQHCFGWISVEGDLMSSGNGDVPESDDELDHALDQPRCTECGQPAVMSVDRLDTRTKTHYCRDHSPWTALGHIHT